MILFFSGTGNSRSVAELLATALGGESINDICAGLPEKTNNESRVIWVFPVYAWNIPPVVRNFVECCEADLSQSEHYLVVTCGDDIGMTAVIFHELLNGKGWSCIAEYSVQMPNNYVCLPGFDVDSKQLEERKLAAMSDRVNAVAEAIKLKCIGEDTVRGGMPRLKSGIVSSFFRRFLMDPSGFEVDNDSCIRCMKCIKNCPLKNISLEDKVEWGVNCAFCLRCYHICPVHAINYGRHTRKKGQYLLK